MLSGSIAQICPLNGSIAVYGSIDAGGCSGGGAAFFEDTREGGDGSSVGGEGWNGGGLDQKGVDRRQHSLAHRAGRDVGERRCEELARQPAFGAPFNAGVAFMEKPRSEVDGREFGSREFGSREFSSREFGGCEFNSGEVAGTEFDRADLGGSFPAVRTIVARRFARVVFNCIVFNCIVFNCIVFNCIVFDCIVLDRIVFGRVIFS
jgi:hypothetical protein